MKIIFFGSAHFALPAIKALLETGHVIPCVVTQPDKKKGRGLCPAKTVIKEFAEKYRITVYQPDKINTPESIDLFEKIKPDLFVVIAYGQILSKRLLDIPVIMPLNVHGSILPFYRGAAPINWAVINGERETGVTVIKMAAKMDSGPVITQKKIDINPEDTFLTLEEKLSLLAARALAETLDLISKNNYDLIPQDESKATFARKLSKKDGLIDWNKPAVNIHNLVRGCLSFPDTFTYYDNKLLKINKSAVIEPVFRQFAAAPGEIIKVSKEGIIVAAKEGYLLVSELQLEGKRRMRVEEFIAGHKIAPGIILGKEF